MLFLANETDQQVFNFRGIINDYYNRIEVKYFLKLPFTRVLNSPEYRKDMN